MDKRQKDIYKILEKYTSIRFNRLKKIIVDEKGLMSERPYRETLSQMVQDGIVLRIEHSRYDVEYSVDFKSYEYEKQGIKYFEEVFIMFDKELDKFWDKRQKLTKLEQSNYLLTIFKAIALMRVKFDEFFFLKKKTVTIRNVEVKLIDLEDITKANIYDEGDDNPHHDIYQTSDNLLTNQAFSYFNEFKENIK